jgi:hypothetical protein
VALLVAHVALVDAGCPSTECVTREDCGVGLDCGADGACIEQAQGSIRWIAPEPGSVVGARFDAVVEVSFRASAAAIAIERDAVDGGEPCAPFVPASLIIAGDLDDALVQQVTLPGLFALGPSFALTATLNAAGGARALRVSFAGEPTGYDGARFVLPADNVIDTGTALTVPTSAVLDRAAARALLSVEPLGGDPSPRQLIGGGLVEFEGALAPVVYGPQVLWLDTEDNTGSHRCGLGISGTAASRAGVELGLSFQGPSPGQLDLHVLVERADGDVPCSYVDPGTVCTPVYESRAPARTGDEILLVDGGRDSVIVVAVVPGAAGPSMTARVRVSKDGVHVGWLGPFPLQPAFGEVWLAGRIVLGGSLARLERMDDVVVGAPF